MVQSLPLKLNSGFKILFILSGFKVLLIIKNQAFPNFTQHILSSVSLKVIIYIIEVHYQ